VIAAAPAQHTPSVDVRLVAESTRIVWAADAEAVRVVVRTRGAGDGYALEFTAASRAYDGAVLEREVRPVSGAAKETFVSRPELTSAYTAVLKDADGAVVATSDPETVTVRPAVTLRSSPLGGGLQLKAAVTGPRRVNGVRVERGATRHAFFYANMAGTLTFHRIGRSPLAADCEKPFCTRLATHDIQSQQLLFETKSFRVCVPGLPFKGMGGSGRCPAELPAE
jgi:hypothetical protein